jgi:hypothetical protein
MLYLPILTKRLTSPFPHFIDRRWLTATQLSLTTLTSYSSCLIGGIGSMPFVGLCNGGGSLAGTLSWVAGMGLVFHQYFKRGLLCQDEEQRFLWPPILGMICRHSKMGPELRANLRPPNANSKFTNPTSSDEPRCGYKWEG